MNTRGVDVVFVYSNSPVWQHHIESELLPLIRERAVVLNWSERRQWRPGLASTVFRFFGGQREFNPIAVVFKPLRRARTFWRPLASMGNKQPANRSRLELIASRSDPPCRGPGAPIQAHDKETR